MKKQPEGKPLTAKNLILFLCLLDGERFIFTMGLIYIKL